MLTIGLFFAGLLAYALVSRWLDRVSVSAQIVMLVLGVGLGIMAKGTSEAIFDTELLGVAGELALILALVVDAARIDIPALRRTARLPIRLLAVGLPLTIVAGTLVAMLVVPGLTLIEAIIVATLLAPTDAALGAVVVNSPIVPRRIRQALNVESGLNDGLVTPIVLVAAASLAVVDANSGDTGWIADAVAQIAFGAIAGVGVGAIGAVALLLAVRRRWMLEGTHWIAAPAVGLLAWFVAHELGGNVFVAAFSAGLALSAVYGRVPDSFLEFAEVGGELVGLIVFFLFGALLVEISAAFSVPIVIYAVLSLTVVRMLPVAISLRGTRLSSPTVAFIGWFGPRGLASIVLTLVALGDGAGPPPFGVTVVATVAVTIALSVILHGLSAGPAVRRYGAFVATLPDEAAEHEATTAMRTRGGVDRRSLNPVDPADPA
jgi:NhaP-type Na+/H+ or K+/H+ antiporter